VLLLGRGGEAFARELAGEPLLAGRVIATGDLEAPAVAAHLAACDVLVQPYADGITTRRTSAMAGLALGVPIVTNQGWLTESVWRESGAVELAASAELVSEAADTLLRNPSQAATIGHRGRLLYRRCFSVDRTIRVLRETEP
jgi:glycosyltransferase involved in cell wall biosynthesis